MMRFLSFRNRDLNDDQLRETLFDLVGAEKVGKLNNLLTEHAARIRALFPGWKVLPAEVRSAPKKTTWWAEGMIGIATAAAKRGDVSLMSVLQGTPEKNELLE